MEVVDFGGMALETGLVANIIFRLRLLEHLERVFRLGRWGRLFGALEDRSGKERKRSQGSEYPFSRVHRFLRTVYQVKAWVWNGAWVWDIASS